VTTTPPRVGGATISRGRPAEKGLEVGRRRGGF